MLENTVLIAGGAGLLGSTFSRYLLNQNYNVIIIDNLSESFQRNVDPRVKFFKLDVSSDAYAIETILSVHKPAYIYSMQAMAAEVTSPWVKRRTFMDNYISLVNLLNASVKYDVKKIIHFSSIAIWAGRNDPPFYENTSAIVNDDYGLSKLMGEEVCKLTKKQFGLNYSIVRAHNFQGPFVNFSSLYRNFLGIAVREALSNKPIPVFGNGEQTRQFSDARYLCQSLQKLMHTDIDIVNLGSDFYHKIIDVANIIMNIAHKDGNNGVVINFLPKRDEALHSWCNHDLAKAKLGFIDNTDIEKLCNDIYFWVKFQPQEKSKEMNFEITKDLPDYWKPSWLK